MNDTTEKTVEPDTSSISQLSTRDERGLINGVNYKVKRGAYRCSIDWRAMIPPEYLVFNRQYQKEIEERYGKSLNDIPVTEVEDKYLLILLPGIKELAELRGYLDIDIEIVKSELNHAAAKCTITWIPNIESGYKTVSRSDVASATLENTNGFGQLFLETIAANRAFVRAVRNYLGVNIVGQDEVGGKSRFANKADIVDSPVPFSPNSLLEQRCSAKKISFEAFKTRVLEAYRADLRDKKPEDWTSFADLKPIDAGTLLELIKE